MQRIRISHSISNISNGQCRQPQKLRGLRHPIGNQKFLRCFSYTFPKNLSEIAAVQTTEVSDTLHRDLILEILLDKGYGFFNIEVLQ